MLALWCGCLAACAAGRADDGTQTVIIHDRTFRLELALDDDTHYKGLSGRTAIDADGGMLFAFSKPRVLEFVMRECVVPIDIIFLGAGGRVVRTHAMRVEPPDRRHEGPQLTRYSSDVPAQFAIELRGGTLQDLHLKPGEKIELPLADLKARAR